MRRDLLMPPKMRHQEAPLDQRDARIQKYLNLAREYWQKAPACLAEDDFHQACEEGLGHGNPADQSRGYPARLGARRPR